MPEEACGSVLEPELFVGLVFVFWLGPVLEQRVACAFCEDVCPGFRFGCEGYDGVSGQAVCGGGEFFERVGEDVFFGDGLLVVVEEWQALDEQVFEDGSGALRVAQAAGTIGWDLGDDIHSCCNESGESWNFETGDLRVGGCG